ncbi:MAG: hypothetical protein F6J87_28465 [Spirulina sp. SIO3F2]|nr:hypothetical protein [Spirulina sp. SIO3F2]
MPDASRSIRSSNLQNPDHHNPNLQGCHPSCLEHNPSQADITGNSSIRLTKPHNTNLEMARERQSLRKGWQLAIVIGLMIAVTGNAVWRLIFSALGQPLSGTAGILVIVLHVVLMGTGLTALGRRRSPRLAYGLGASLSAAVIGFCYGGSWFNETLLPAVIGAVLLAIVGDFLSWYGREGLMAIAILTAIVTVSSAAVFLLGTTAIAGVATQHWLGVIFCGLTGFYLWLTWCWSEELGLQIHRFCRNRDVFSP